MTPKVPPRSSGAALVLMGLALGACSGSTRERSVVEASTSGPTTTEEPVPRRLARFDEVETFATVSRLRTSHPVGDYAATIRVDPLAASYGKSAREPMPVGAMIVEAMAGDPEAPPQLYYVMERREPGYFPEGGDWEYAVLGPDGTTTAAGKLALCARCHGEAPREHLFERIVSP